MTRPVCPGQWPSRPLWERAVAWATVACAAQAHSWPPPPAPLWASPWLPGCLPLTISMSICPQCPAFVSRLGTLFEVLSVQWVLGASAGKTAWGARGLPLLGHPPPLPMSPSLIDMPPGTRRHPIGTWLGHGDQSLRPVLAQPEVPSVFRPRTERGRAGQSCTICAMGNRNALVRGLGYDTRQVWAHSWHTVGA